MKHAILLCALFVLAGAVHAQEAIFRYEKGKEYKYLLESSETQIQEVQGQTMNMSSETTVSATYKVDEVFPDATRKGTWTIEKAMLSQESSDGNSRTMGKEMAGATLVYTMDLKGDVADVDTVASKADGPAAGVLMMLANILPGLDVTKMKVGEKWSSVKTDTAGEGGSDNYTIQKRKNDFEVIATKDVKGRNCLSINVVGTSEIEGKMSRGDQDITITGEGSSKGTILYDAKDGILAQMNIEVTQDRTAVVGGNMRIPISSSTTISMELLP
jgi:hypothetical protein